MNIAMATRNNITKIKLNLKEIPISDMIHLHKQTREFIYTYLIMATLNLSKLQSTVPNIGNQLRQEKVENKVH